ncbi:hypothetical protein L9F63_012724, partial [Diploptera punctata]
TASGILKGCLETLEDARRSLWRNIIIATPAVKVYVNTCLIMFGNYTSLCSIQELEFFSKSIKQFVDAKQSKTRESSLRYVGNIKPTTSSYEIYVADVKSSSFSVNCKDNYYDPVPYAHFYCAIKLLHFEYGFKVQTYFLIHHDYSYCNVFLKAFF